ncbi:MAG: hypothetical protein HW387_1672 [Parachlamydiales bacterium]|nr:hypothetical protein [Parachlamydiales bacterium]
MTVSGIISSLGAVTKNNNGILTFSGAVANTYLGLTTVSSGTLALNKTGGAVAVPGDGLINGGTLSLSAASQIATTSALTMSSGTFNMNGHAQTLKSFTYQGGTFSQGGATLTLSNNGTALTMRDTTISGNITLAGGTTPTILFDTTNNGTAIISGNLDLGGNATTFSVPRGTATNDMALSGNIANGSLAKTSNGILVMSGNNSYSGGTTVSAGHLIVNGNLSSILNAVTVSAGAYLSGTGTIAGDVDVLGSITPGNSIGTITVGSLTLHPASITNIEIDPASASLIAVTGAALLDGQLNIQMDAGSYSTADYTILTSASLSGTFNSVVISGLPVGSLGSVSYPLNTVLFSLLMPPLSRPPGLSGNALSFFNYLQGFITLPRFSSIYTQLNSLSPDELTRALITLQPGRNASTTFASQNTMFDFTQIIASRFAEQRFLRSIHPHVAGATAHVDSSQLGDGCLIAANDLCVSNKMVSIPAGSVTTYAKESKDYAVWMDGFGSFSKESDTNQNTAFHAAAGGALLNADYYGWTGGVFTGGIGYSSSNLHMNQNAGKGSVNACIANLFSTFYLSDFYVELGVLGSYDYYSNWRYIAFPGVNLTAKSSHKGASVTPRAEIGVDFNFNWATIEPYVAIDWVFCFEKGFSEKGAGIYNMQELARKSNLIRGEAGINAYEYWNLDKGTIILKEKLAYVYKQPNHTGLITASLIGAPDSFTVDSFTRKQHLWLPGFEIFYRSNKNAFASISYAGEFGDDSSSNEVQAKLGCYF